MDWLTRNTADEGAQAIADYMAKLASAPTPHAPRMPAADVLWVKAQMLKRWDAERRAQAPLDVMESVQIAAGLAAAAVLFVWSLPSILQALSILRG
jgi:hypothetical protein